MASLKSFLNAVDKKINSPKVKMMLQFGQTYNSKAVPLRDKTGFAVTRESIMQTASNAWSILDGRVGLDSMFQNFSSNAGYSDVSDVRTIGAIDLTILAMSQSLVPFVCVDRGLSTPESTIYFNNLIACNTAGGVSAGDNVSGNFTPPNTDVYLGNGREKTITGGTEIILGNNLLKGTVVVKVTVSDTEYTGKDFGQDGKIYFDGGAVTATVDYASGKVTLTGSFDKASATASVDPTLDATGSDVLTVKPEWTAVQLVSEPMNIVLQNNIANMMYMQKTYALATGSSSKPYNDVLFQRVKNTYIESINSMILRKVIKAASYSNPLKIDLSSYDVKSFANTKNDLICQLVSSMKATMLGRTGVGLSALIVNSNAAALLEQVTNQFVPNPMISMGINGLIGYFAGIPVFRHNVLDNKWGTFYQPGSDGIMFGVYRSADNMSGSQVFGEFIPFFLEDKAA